MELTLSKIISWVSGIGLLLLGVVFALISVVGGIITILIGLFALPPVRRRITDQTGIGFSRWLVLAVVVVGATAGVGIVGSNIDSSDDTESPAGGGVSESPATDRVADANDEESDSTDQTPEPTATPTATSTPTPTSTPPPTATPTLTPTSTPIPEASYSVRIEYEGEWQASLSITATGESSTRSISGSGSKTIDVTRDASVISVNGQKQDDSTRELTVQILENGAVVAESSTTAEYGLAQVSESFF